MGARPQQPVDDGEGAATRPFDRVDDDEQRPLVGRSQQEVGDRLDQELAGRLGIERVDGRERTDPGGEPRREPPDLATVFGDVRCEHVHRRDVDEVIEHLAEWFERRLDVLAASSEQRGPPGAVRDLGSGTGEGCLADAGFALEQDELLGSVGLGSRPDGVEERHRLIAGAERTVYRRAHLGLEQRLGPFGVRRDLLGLSAEVDEFVDRLDPVDTAQHLLTEEAQFGVVGECGRDQLGRCAAEEHLSAAGDRSNARRPVDGLTVVVAPAEDRLARVDSHSDAHRCRRIPRLRGDPALRIGRRADRVGGPLEHAERAVALAPVLQEKSPVSIDGGLDQLVVAAERRVHDAGRPFPQRGGIDDIGEQEREQARRERPRRPVVDRHSSIPPRRTCRAGSCRGWWCARPAPCPSDQGSARMLAPMYQGER